MQAHALLTLSVLSISAFCLGLMPDALCATRTLCKAAADAGSQGNTPLRTRLQASNETAATPVAGGAGYGASSGINPH